MCFCGFGTCLIKCDVHGLLKLEPKRKQKEERKKKLEKEIKVSDYNWPLNYEEEEGHPEDM